jgi:acetyltransferase-like isoleucine patch superfamily enzyme
LLNASPLNDERLHMHDTTDSHDQERLEPNRRTRETLMDFVRHRFGDLHNLSYSALLYATNRIVAYVPSHRFRLWFYRNIMQMQIGRGSAIFMGAWIDARGGFSMGKHSIVNQGCRLDARGRLQIGDNVSISAEVCILTADHDISSPDFAGRCRPVCIGDRVFIGTRAMILPGVTVGHGSAVAAAAVVTKDVPDFAVVAGVPAKIIGSRSRDLRYTLSYRRPFH